MQNADKKIIIHSFADISPVNSVEEGIRLGHFNSCRRYINDRTVQLPRVTVKKHIHFVCLNQTVGETDYGRLLKMEKKRPCRFPANFLLGVMVKVPHEKMPPEFADKYIVAAEPDDNSCIFKGRICERAFLCVDCNCAGRMLRLADAKGRWTKSFVFITEDLVQKKS